MKVLPLSCKKKNVLKKHFVYKYKDTLKILTFFKETWKSEHEIP